MYGVEFPSEDPFVYSIFGVQYEGESPSEAISSRIQALDGLISSSATYTDNLVEDGRGHLDGWNTRIWLSYWPTAKVYDEWWQSPGVTEFWSSLPADAGIYREVIQVSPARTQFGTNKEKKSGLSNLGSLAPLGEKVFYWGCYRDRYKDATPENRMNSTLESLPKPSRPTTGPSPIRSGRTKITTFPDNLCFVVEGQDHSAISAEEKNHWFENFDGVVTTWMQDLMNASPDTGVLDAKICYAGESGVYREGAVPALNYNRKVQLFWFLDHRHMEKIGRSNKGHVALRKSFIQSYCPTGPMGSAGQLMLWVETSVVKADQIEAEYIGAVEGTGFMAYGHHPEFQSITEA